jgi:hypothetical protein
MTSTDEDHPRRGQMPGKSIPISVRITPGDAAFLAQRSIEGAKTPSEKIRGLIAQSREQQSSRRTYAESVAHLRTTSSNTRKASTKPNVASTFTANSLNASSIGYPRRWPV